jgi:hypothetical protein
MDAMRPFVTKTCLFRLLLANEIEKTNVFSIIVFYEEKMNNTQFTHKCMTSNHNIETIKSIANILN